MVFVGLLLASVAATVGVAVPAQAAATGRVVVFSTELTPLEIYENPHGCHAIPVTSHVLVNLMTSRIVVYGNPFCFGLGLPIAAGYGSHVVPPGSFFA